MKTLRNIIRENRLDSDSPHALGQLIIVSRITKKSSHAQTSVQRLYSEKRTKKKWSHNSVMESLAQLVAL